MTRTNLLVLALPFALLGSACDADENDNERAAAVELGEHDRADRSRGWMAKLDADGDGAISREEAEGHFLAKKFDKLDTNGDGMLSADELATFKKGRGHGKWKRGGHDMDPQERATRMMTKLDTDGDGSISRAEAEGHFLAKKFDKLDTNGDGMLSADELSAMKKHGKWKHGKRNKDPQAFATRMMSKLDTDGDGAISLAEAEGSRIGENFSSIDADGDGKISADELAAHMRSKFEKAAQG